jgi:hypothetical protein
LQGDVESLIWGVSAGRCRCSPNGIEQHAHDYDRVQPGKVMLLTHVPRSSWMAYRHPVVSNIEAEIVVEQFLKRGYANLIASHDLVLFTFT